MNTRFGVLHETVDENDSISSANERRKAEKKLREIAALKQKLQLTKEERDKLAKESYWEQFIPNTNRSQKIDKKEEEIRKEKQFKRHVEKEKQKNARIWAETMRKKREEEERAKQLAEINAKYEENREQQRQRYEEHREQQRQRYEKETRERIIHAQHELTEKMFTQSIMNEFITAVAIHNTPDRAFRKLSLKYHPDKNPENKDRAEKIQKILVDIREMYSV